MVMFYNYPSWYSMIASVLALMCLLFGTVVLIYGIYSRHNGTLEKYFNEIYQVLLLCICFVSLEMIAYIRMGIEKSRLLIPRYNNVRLILCFLTVICFFIKETYHWKSQDTDKKKSTIIINILNMILNLLPVLIILPSIESMTGKNYPYFFLIGNLIESIYSLCLIFRDKRNLKEKLSWYSVKEAVDRLPTGVLFAKKNGTILLINLQMQKLSDIIWGRQLWDARKFYDECLDETKIQNNCKVIKLDNSYVCILPDKSIWLFSKTELVLRKQKDIQITATNITRQWEMAQEEEISNIRSRFHDILGQRIAILLRSLREGKIPDDQLLTTFINDFYNELEETAHKEKHIEQLNSLCKAMEKIGVDLRFEMDCEAVNESKSIDLNTVIDITEREEKDLGLCLDVLREACTNAVRHGFASYIMVSFKYSSDELQIHIRNDGIIPDAVIHEGSGLKSIRRKLEAVGGSLSVLTDPQFALQITLRRNLNDQGIDC